MFLFQKLLIKYLTFFNCLFPSDKSQQVENFFLPSFYNFFFIYFLKCKLVTPLEKNETGISEYSKLDTSSKKSPRGAL